MAAKLGLLVVVLSISFPDTALAVHEPPCSYGPESTNEWGRWEYVGNTDILAVHAALLRNGNVLLFGGSEHTKELAGKVGSLVDKTRIYIPETRMLIEAPPAPLDFTDVFCSGTAQLGDGSILVAGGMGGWQPGGGDANPHSAHFPGTRATWMFVPNTRDGHWERKEDMKGGGGRWYPTLVTLPNGAVLAMSGHPDPALGDTRHINNTPEVFTAGSWRLLFSDDIGMQGPSTHYPHAYVLPRQTPFVVSGLPDSDVFFASQARDGSYYLGDNLTGWQPDWKWVASAIGDKHYEPERDPMTGLASNSHYLTTSVLLPLDPVDSYEPKILLMGGETAKLIKPRGSARWEDTGQRVLTERRVFASSVILPTGHVVLTGGVSGADSRGVWSDDNGVREVEIYNPAEDNNGKWYLGPTACAVRNYHSVALLLPDGSVLVAGSNHNADIDLRNRELRVEVFKPWYFNHRRPSLLGVPKQLPVGRPFIVSVAKPLPNIDIDQGDVPPPEKVSQLVLVRTSTVTHGLNTDQRLVRLSFNTMRDSSQFAMLSARTPPDTNVAPPGYYLMFAITERGIPSKGEFIRITNPPRVGRVFEDLFRGTTLEDVFRDRFQGILP